MRDSDFLTLDEATAKNHAWGQSDEERMRLRDIYKNSHNINLADVVSEKGVDAPGSVAAGGWWLFGLGVVGALIAFVFPVGVEVSGLYGADSVANIDKIAIRHMILAVSLAMFVGGCALIGAGAIQKELRPK